HRTASHAYHTLSLHDALPIFYLGGAHAVAGHIEHVINPAGNPVITIRIAPCPVTSEVITRIGAVIGIDATLVVTVNSTDLAGPRRFDCQVAFTHPLNLPAFGVQQHWLYAKEGHCG